MFQLLVRRTYPNSANNRNLLTSKFSLRSNLFRNSYNSTSIDNNQPTEYKSYKYIKSYVTVMLDRVAWTEKYICEK